MQLEQVVRPFSSPNPLNQSIVVSQVTKIPLAYARITWGAVGNLTAPSGGGFKVIECDDKYKEQKRTLGDPYTISNPSDPTQFVIFQNISTISFSHQNKDDDKITISYNKTQTLYGVPMIRGVLAPYVNVLTNDAAICQAEYDLKDQFSTSTT